MNKPFSLDRRELLKTTGFLTLSFAIPFDLARAADLPRDLERNLTLGSWIEINADTERATLKIGKVELGQGALTAVKQVCADELDVNWDQLDIISGDTALVPDEGTTAGSQTMPNCASAVRQASAEVRAILLGLAAERLGVDAGQLTVADATITAPDGTTTTYWEVVTGEALNVDATGLVSPKDPHTTNYRYVGHSVPRLDIPAKVTGQPIFVQDHRPEGMVHGRIVRPPTYQATLTSVDTGDVEAMPGVIKVVRDGSFLGVIAEREEQAIAAAFRLGQSAEWNVESNLPGSDGIYEWLQRDGTTEARDIQNEPRSGGGEVARTVETTYLRPYHMHGSIGTSAAVATLGDDGVMLIQTHSQSVFATAEAIAAMLAMPVDKVRCQHHQGSGCYGHNNADDAAADAALLAAAVPGRPVRLQYMRPDEHLWEPYGSAMVMKTSVGVDANGDILDWAMDVWSTPHGTRPGGDPGNLLSARYLESAFDQPVPSDGGPPNYAAGRNAIPLYTFPGSRTSIHFTSEMPLRVSSTRGLGAYANVFAIESTIDQLAHDAGVDPVEYRLRYMQDPRGRDIIMKVAELFGWDDWEPSEGRGRGIGFAKYKNLATYCAVAIEVDVNLDSGVVRAIRAAATADAGHLVSPDGVANQIEGGLIQSLSWSLKEEVRFDHTKVLSEDWDSYPILTFSEVPPIEVALIDRVGEPFLGTGEASQGPTVGALANAIYDATGKRFTQIPFTPNRIRQGLSS